MAGPRPDWDDVWLQLAVLMGQRSRCGPRKSGAVIVSPHQRVISTGYAGPPAHYKISPNIGPSDSCAVYCNRPHIASSLRDPGYNDCVSSHAEANAIIMADRSLIDGGAFYISTVPCFSCTKMIANTGVAMVVWVNDGRCDSSKTTNFFKMCNIIPDARKIAVGPENSQ